jgi:hypothetical protein
MQTIGIGELQKNVGILAHLNEALTVVDKRKNKKIAVIYPIDQTRDDIVETMAQAFRQRARKRGIVIEDLDRAKTEAMQEALGERYGFAD